MKCVRRVFILILAANLILMIGSTAVNAAKASSEAVQFDLGWQAYESGRYKEALRIWQTLAENGYAQAQIVLKDEISDIAILKADTPNELPPALPLARRHAELGAQVFTIGFPGAEMLSNSPKLTHGRISSLKGLNNDPALYQTTVPIQAGNSGSPLVNMKGEVVGVIRSILGLINESDGELYLVQNASCALKIENLNMLLTRLPATGPVGTRVQLNHKGKEDVYRQIQDSMLMVIAR